MADTITYTYTYGEIATSATNESNSTKTSIPPAVVAAGQVITSSIVLPSQTESFDQPESCAVAPTIVCDNLEPTVTCTGVASAAVPIDDTCFPEGYKDVFYDVDGVYRDIRSLVYAGTACPISWTVACSTSLPDLATAPESIASQSWCCPSGWGCEPAGPRLCQSFAQTRTSILLADGTETEHSVFMVHTPVFPLQADLDSSPPDDPDAPAQVGGDGGLGAGAIVGIVFGLVVLLGCIGLGWYLWRYLKRKRESDGVMDVEEVEMNGLDGNGRRYRDNDGGVDGGQPGMSGALGSGAYDENEASGSGDVDGDHGGGSGSGSGQQGKIAGGSGGVRYA